MGQWTDRVKGHAVWGQLSAVGPIIDQALARDDVGEQEVEGLERIRAVLALVGKRLAAADPFTTFPTPLDAIVGAFQNATSELQAFVANGSPGHIVNANSHADTALSSLAHVIVPVIPTELQELQLAAVKYRETLQEQVKRAMSLSEDLESGTRSLRETIQALTSEITAEKQRLSQLASGFQSQFSTAQETRIREFGDAQKAQQSRAEELLKEQEDTLAEQVARFETEGQEARAKHQELLDSLRAQFADAATALLDGMDEQRKHVEKLVGVIGNLGVTSGYLTTAERARKTTYLWQAIAVLAMLGLILFGWHAFLPVMDTTSPFNWAAFASRALLTLTVGVLAAYAAKQGDKAQETERRNRKMALELEAVGPFLAPLSKEQQDQFRLALGERSFGRDDPGRGQRDKSPATVVDLLGSKGVKEMVSEVVSAAVKATRP